MSRDMALILLERFQCFFIKGIYEIYEIFSTMLCNLIKILFAATVV